MAAATSIISARAITKVLSNLPPGVIPLYTLPGSTADGGGTVGSNISSSAPSDGLSSAAGADPVGYMLNGVVYTKYDFMVQISASLTLLLGIVQLVMGIIHSYLLVLILSYSCYLVLIINYTFVQLCNLHKNTSMCT